MIRRVVTSVLFALGVLVLAGGIGSRLLDLRMQTVLSGAASKASPVPIEPWRGTR